jgi:uncharacterized membrane protein YidH (DUF202 family)
MTSIRRAISLLCAVALLAAGAVICFFEFSRFHSSSPVNGAMVAGGIFLFIVGLAWLTSDIQQWNDWHHK